MLQSYSEIEIIPPPFGLIWEAGLRRIFFFFFFNLLHLSATTLQPQGGTSL